MQAQLNVASTMVTSNVAATLRAPSAVSRASAAVSALAGVRPCPALRSGAGISQQLLRPCNPLSSRVQPAARRSHGTASRSIVRAQANGSGLMIDLTGARDWTFNTPDQDVQGVATHKSFQILSLQTHGIDRMQSQLGCSVPAGVPASVRSSSLPQDVPLKLVLASVQARRPSLQALQMTR